MSIRMVHFLIKSSLLVQNDVEQNLFEYKNGFPERFVLIGFH